MNSADHPLRQVGIYRNLPTFDATITELTAIVTGANGISGFNALRALLSSPERWARIYTLSRSPLSEKQLSLIPAHLRCRIQHVAVDLGASPETTAIELNKWAVKADYIFYYTYVQPSVNGMSGMDPRMADKLCDANVPLFRNFLKALDHAHIEPKRILIQTGGKNYGIGRVRTPMVESDPQPRHLSRNFYYDQENDLKEFCARHNTGWNVIRPAAVIGVTHGSPLNTFYPFGVYAAVQAYKNEPLRFGGNFESWQFQACHSSSRMTGYLCEWAVLEDKCANQAFNAHDGGGLSWDRFFEELARWFDVAKGVERPLPDDQREFSTTTFAGGKQSPLGYGPALTLNKSFSLSEWFKDTTNPASWEEMMKDSGGQLETNVFAEVNANEIASDFAYLAYGSLSLNKVRRFEFNGFVDSLESIFETYQDMGKLRMLPPMVAKSAKPLI